MPESGLCPHSRANCSAPSLLRAHDGWLRLPLAKVRLVRHLELGDPLGRALARVPLVGRDRRLVEEALERRALLLRERQRPRREQDVHLGRTAPGTQRARAARRGGAGAAASEGGGRQAAGLP